MNEILWNDELPERYNGCKNVSRYYGHIKNQQNLVYICDKEEHFTLHHYIAETLKSIKDTLNSYQEKGYEYYEYKFKTERDDNGGLDIGYAELEFYRKETEEEKQIRLDDVRDDIKKRLENLKIEAEKAHRQLEDLKKKLDNKA